MKNIITYYLLISCTAANLCFVSAAHCQVAKEKQPFSYKSKVWVADNGDGTYKNPILYADYSDPDVIRRW